MSTSVVPSDWQIASLEACVDILDSQRAPVNNKERQARIQNKSPEQLYPYFGATGEVGKIDDYLFDEELVALGEDGVPFLDPRKSKAYLLSGKTWVNNHAHVLRAAEGMTTNQFLLHFLNQFDYQEYVNGGTRLKLTQANMRRMPFPLPPLAEQKVIADKLDTLLAQSENTKARLERIPQILKRFRQSVLAEAVSGRLTEEWRRGQSLESVSVAEIKRCHSDYALAKGRKYSEPSRFKDSNTVYRIPQSWKWFRAEELCDLITKGTTPKKADMSGDGHVPFIKVYNLTFDGTLDFSIEPTFISKQTHENALKRSKSYPGDVLMNIVGPPLGKVSIVPDTFPEWNLNQAISIFRPVTGVTPGYLALCLRDTALLEQTKNKAKATAGQFNLTLEICRDYAIPVPSLKEQTEIVRRVDRLFAHADRIEQQVNNALARVNNLTQSILAKAFRGELTEQWRKDNPELISGENSAEALLERIKAERAAMKPVKKTRNKRTTV